MVSGYAVFRSILSTYKRGNTDSGTHIQKSQSFVQSVPLKNHKVCRIRLLLITPKYKIITRRLKATLRDVLVSRKPNLSII